LWYPWDLNIVSIGSLFMEHPHPFVGYPHPFVGYPHPFVEHLCLFV
jgi:hypothetical protein